MLHSAQKETTGAGNSELDPARPTLAPKSLAKPSFATRKRPGSALPPKPAPAKLPATAATASQSKHATAMQPELCKVTCRNSGAAQPVQNSRPAPPKLKGADRAAHIVQAAAPPAKKCAEQDNADEAGAAAKAPRNRAKAADLDVAVVGAKIKAKYAEKELGKLSIPEIKCFLKSKKLAVGGKKGDLVNRLAEYLDTSK